jgi:hypothetical protein
VLHEISVSDPVLAAPSGYNVCLRVGGLDVKSNFVAKLDVVGPIGVSSWLADSPCLWRSLKCMSSAGCSRFCAVICSSYIWRLHLILQPQEICSSSGSHVGLHEPFTSSLLRNLKVHSFFSFLLRLTEAGQAHVCVCVCVTSIWSFCSTHSMMLRTACTDAMDS